ncbi:hypothetical protein R1flu_006158 [Riccia fluitans]|uniref:Uncharacterized protein n=1 Tax=Riccia fluitans TaxID=41844 RepID=A0ABD1YW90_9MARC
MAKFTSESQYKTWLRNNESFDDPSKKVGGTAFRSEITPPRRKSVNNKPVALHRGSVDYGQLHRATMQVEEESEKGSEAEDDLPQELKEHMRRKRMFSRLRLKKLEEARYGLYVPLSPRTVERRRRSKQNIRKIVSALKMSPRVMGKKGDKNKDWRIRPSACQSDFVRGLRGRLQERKEKMKPYTNNKLFEKILDIKEEERVWPTPEEFWRQSIASKFEKMARELIDRTSYMTARIQHGIWSQTGMPYTCLGLPSTNRPATAPLPDLKMLRQLLPYEHPPFDFFPACADTELMAALAEKEAEERHASYEDGIAAFACDLSDMDYSRFPMEQIQFTAKLVKRVKGGGRWLEEIDEGMMKSIPRELSVTHYTGRTIVGPAGNVEHFGYLLPPLALLGGSSSSESHEVSHMQLREDEKKELATTLQPPHRHSEHKEPLIRLPWSQRKSHAHTEQSFIMCQSPTKQLIDQPPEKQLESIDWKADQSLVFNLKRKNLTARRKIMYDLKKELTAVSDRREHWRGVTSMTAELCKRLESILFRTKGRRAPSTKHIWSTAQRLHPVPKDKERPDYESEAYSINRFYDRVCTFIDHQKMADPLMDVLIYLLREMLLNGQKLQADLLLVLCERLARIPEEVASSGRMVCIFPVLHFIAKELRISSTEYDLFINKSGIDRLQPT